MSVGESPKKSQRGTDYSEYEDVFKTLDEVVRTIIEERDVGDTNLGGDYPVGSGSPLVEVRRGLLLFSDYLFAKFKDAGLTPRHIVVGMGGVPYMDFYVTVPAEEENTLVDYYIDMSMTPNAGRVWYAPGKSRRIHRVDIALRSDESDMIYTLYHTDDDKYVYLDIPAKTPIRYTGTISTLSIDDVLRLYGYTLMILSNVSVDRPKYLFLRRDQAYSYQVRPGMYIINKTIRARYRYKWRDEKVFAVIAKYSDWAHTYAEEIENNAHPIFKLLNTTLAMNSNIENKDEIY